MQKENDNDKVTSYSMAQTMAAGSPVIPLDNAESLKGLKSKIKAVVMGNYRASKYFALISPGFKYLTIFRKNEDTGVNDFIDHIVGFLVEESDNLGGYKGAEFISDISEQLATELWFGSDVYMFFKFDSAVEEV